MDVLVSISTEFSFYVTTPVLKRYAELKGINLTAYIGDEGYRQLVRIPLPDQDLNYLYYLTADLGAVISDANDPDVVPYFLDSHDIDRTDADLLAAVRELSPPNLKIVSIPDGVEFGIGETGFGREYIFEKHRTWS